MKGVVKVELDILDRVEMGRQLNGEVRLYSANNKVVYMPSRVIMAFKNILYILVICLDLQDNGLWLCVRY